MQSGTLDNLKITIVVDKVQAHDHGSSCIDDWGGGCGWADFYPEAYINDVGPDDINGTSLGGKSYEIGDEDKIHPGSNWPLFRTVKFQSNGCTKVPPVDGPTAGLNGCAKLQLRIYDSDSGLLSARGADDAIDINDLNGWNEFGPHLNFRLYWKDDVGPIDTMSDSLFLKFRGCNIEIDSGDIPAGGNDEDQWWLTPMNHDNAQFPSAAPEWSSRQLLCNGNNRDHAGVRLTIKAEMTGDPLYIPNDVTRVLVIPDKILPDSSEPFTLRAAAVDPMGMNKNVDEIQIFVSNTTLGGSNSNVPDVVCLSDGIGQSYNKPQAPSKAFTISPNGGKLCELEVGPFDNNPPSISFSAVAYKEEDKTLWWQSKNRTISFDHTAWDYENGPIGLNIGSSPETGIDILFAPESDDFSPPCIIEEDPLLAAVIGAGIEVIEFFGADIDDATEKMVEMGWGMVGTHNINCSGSTYNSDYLRQEIQQHFEKNFFAAEQWGRVAYSDVLMNHQDQLNFWFTEKPVHTEADMFHVLDESWDRGHGFADVVFVMREESIRANAHPIHRTVSSPMFDQHGNPDVERFQRMNHELGHNPFGLADVYDSTCNKQVRSFNTLPGNGDDSIELRSANSGCVATIYYQRAHKSNVYADLEASDNGEIFSYLGLGENLGIAEILFDEFDFLEEIPGCNDDPALVSDGIPFPPGLSEITDTFGNPIFNDICDEIDTSGDPVGNWVEENTGSDWDWFRAEPKESGMGYHSGHDHDIPFYELYLNASGLPVTDNNWQFGPASAARIEWIFNQCENDRTC